MASYINGTVTDQNDIAVAGAKVYIYGSDGNLASLRNSLSAAITQPIVTSDIGYWEAYFVAPTDNYSIKYYWGGRLRATETFTKGADGATGSGTATVLTRAALAAIAAPANNESRLLIEAGRTGLFKFSTANLSALVTADTAQGVYVAPTAAPTGASGAWVRQYDGYWIFDWFGAVPGDYATGRPPDSDAAFDALQSLAVAVRRNVSVPYSAGAPEVFFPGALYAFAAKMRVRTALQLLGRGTGTEGYEPTWLWFYNDTAGIHEEWDNTFDTTYGSSIVGFTIQGTRATPTGVLTTDLLKSGIRCNARTYVDKVLIRNFTGAGQLLSAANGAPGEFNGNINGSDGTRVAIRDCYSGGVFMSGGDANVIKLDGYDVGRCGRYSFWVSPFLAAVLINCQSDHSGVPSVSGLTEYALVHYGGRIYQARYNASTATLQATTPGTNEAVWMDLSAGGATADTPTWTGLANYVPGGHYGGTGAFTVCVACYHETGTTIPDMPGAICIGGFMGSGVGYTPQLNVSGLGLTSNVGFARTRTYIDGTVAKVAMGSAFGNDWVDVVSWNSSEATPGNTELQFGLTLDKTTGDLVYLVGGATAPNTGFATPRTLGPSNNRGSGRVAADVTYFFETPGLINGGANGLTETVGSAAPTTGTWKAGDKQRNNGAGATSVATTEYWLCTVAGTPGTWVAK